MTTTLLSKRVKHLLASKELSESELARRIDIPRATLNRLIAGKMVNPKMHVLASVANYFELSVDELVKTQPIGTRIAMVPWENIHELGSQGLHQQMTWKGAQPPKNAFLTRPLQKDLGQFPNQKQLLLIAPLIKPRPGQLVVLHMKESRTNVVKIMFLHQNIFHFKDPCSPHHEQLNPDLFRFVGVVHQVLQLD